MDTKDIERMTARKLIYVIFALVLFSVEAGAQSVVELNKGEVIKRGTVESVLRGGTITGMTGVIDKTMDMKNNPIDVNRLPDDIRMKEIEKDFQNREWQNEETAWQRASKEDTKESYEKYIAIYPNGAHRPDATARLIQMRVNDAFTGAHENFPPLERTYADDDSPVSTVVVNNSTGQPLTVMYSGLDTESIVIEAGGRGVVTVKNGYYNIAASVPAVSVRDFAGTEVLRGGRYEVTFYIVRR